MNYYDCPINANKSNGYSHRIRRDTITYRYTCDSLGNTCDSKWRDDLVNDWKEDVCCGEKGMEPNRNNGSCQDPKTPNIGVGYSKIAAFPGCSSTPAGKGENNYCKPPPSSSSDSEPSSSSYDEPESSSSNAGPSSSSEQQEDAECYANDLEANAAYDGKIWRCIQAGNVPNFRLDGRRCITGECMERSSSSEGASSSSSGDGGDGQCLVASQKLLKSSDEYYDGWVYMGKESYGSRHVTRSSIKPGTKFFDVLGRAYDKMKARIKYYVFKDAIEREEFDVSFEFEVMIKIVKDSEGNDVQLFIKEDKARELRRDSSFYWDGYWEVFDFDDLTKETRFRTSSGIRSLRRYDDVGHLKERNMIDSNGDTLTSEQYEWKNGRLIRMTANGVVRNYIYGKTLQDTVHVVPSDEGFNFHSGYNGTVRKMPEEGEPGYKIFIRGPYGHVSFGDEEKEELSVSYSASRNFSSLNILTKVTTSECVIEDPAIKKIAQAKCIRYTRNEAQRADINFGFPRENGRLIYGTSDAKLSLKFSCECNKEGKYQPSFSGKTINEKLEVNRSIWRYVNYYTLDWHEFCFNDSDLQETYNHEAKHIKNAVYMADSIPRLAKKDNFDTKEECEGRGRNDYNRLMDKWDEWHDREWRHINLKPKSPEQTKEAKNEYPCY